MLKPFPLIMAIIGLSTISYVIHESIHLAGVENPIRVCFGIEGNISNPEQMSAATVYFTGREFWYGSEWIAYAIQFAFVLLGTLFLIYKY